MVFENKKAFSWVFVILGAVVFLFVVAISMLIHSKSMNTVENLVADNDYFDNESLATFQEAKTTSIAMFDNVFVILLALASIFVWGAAYYSFESPWWLIAAIIIVAILYLVGSFLSSSYELNVLDTFQEFENDYPKMNWIMKNLWAVITLQFIVGGFIILLNGGVGRT